MEIISTLNENSIDKAKRLAEKANLEPKTQKEKELMKVSQDFEAVFIAKMFKTLDEGVERSGMFSKGQHEQMFKNLMFNELAQEISSNPATSFGLAKQMYEQMRDML